MVRRSTWVLLIVFLLLLALAWYLQRGESEQEAESTPTLSTVTEKLFDVDDISISRFRVEGAEGKAIEISRDEAGLWSMIEPQADVIDVDAVESLVNKIVSLSVLAKLDPAPEFKDIGLMQPSYYIRITLDNGSQQVAYIGDLTPTNSGYYVLVGDGFPVVVSKFSLESVLDVLDNPPLPATPTPQPVTTDTEDQFMLTETVSSETLESSP